jgi:hypothetical protein
MMDKDNCNRNSGGKPVPRDLPFFRQLISCGGRGGKALYKNAEGFFFQWDSLHGEWEKFSKTGRHLGALSPDGQNVTKDAVKGRKIKI